MIDDFKKEAEKRAKAEILMTPAQKEIQEFAKDLYFDLKKGTSQKWVWTTSTLLTKSIDSEITKEDLVKAGFEDWEIDLEWVLKQKVEELPYGIFRYLCSKHFDVFRLIENKLAIDINTIK